MFQSFYSSMMLWSMNVACRVKPTLRSYLLIFIVAVCFSSLDFYDVSNFIQHSSALIRKSTLRASKIVQSTTIRYAGTSYCSSIVAYAFQFNPRISYSRGSISCQTSMFLPSHKRFRASIDVEDTSKGSCNLNLHRRYNDERGISINSRNKKRNRVSYENRQSLSTTSSEMEYCWNYDILFQNIMKCQSMFDLYFTLSSSIEDDTTYSMKSSIDGRYINQTIINDNPRIALLVLNRIISILLPSMTTRKTMLQNQNERQILKQLLVLVFTSIERSLGLPQAKKNSDNNTDQQQMKQQRRELSLNKFSKPTLKDRKGYTMRNVGTNPTTTSLVPLNEYRLAESFVSISILINYFNKRDDDANGFVDDDDDDYCDLLRSRAFHTVTSIWKTLEHRNNASQGKVLRQLSTRRLTQCLHSYSLLLLNSYHEKNQLTLSTSLHEQICRRLTDSDAIAQLTPNDLLIILRSLLMKNSIIMREQSVSHHHHNVTFDDVQVAPYNLLLAVIRRCRKKSIRDQSKPSMLLSILELMRKFWQKGMVTGFDNSVRRTNDDDIYETTSFTNSSDTTTTNDGSSIVHKIRDIELPKLVYTIALHLVYTNETHDVHSMYEPQQRSKYTISEMALIISTVHEVLTTTTLKKNLSSTSCNEDPLIQAIYRACSERLITTSSTKNDNVDNDSTSTIRNIARILVAFEEWGVGNERNNNNNVVSSVTGKKVDVDNKNNDVIVVYTALGYAFMDVVMKVVQHRSSGNNNTTTTQKQIVNKQSSFTTIPTIDPRDINMILRCAVLFHGTNSSVITPYWNGAAMLFLYHNDHDDTDDSRNNNPNYFLQSCRLYDLANFVWFVSRVKIDNNNNNIQLKKQKEQMLISLGEFILQSNDRHNVVSSKLASRIITSFTKATYTSVIEKSLTDETLQQRTKLEYILSELFRVFGESLLTMQLSVTETSSLLYSYAKASYFDDLGILDHLINVMTRHMMTIEEQSNHNKKNYHWTIRQGTQSLWACGKIIEWETKIQQDQSCNSNSNYNDVGDDSDVITTTTNSPTYIELPPYTRNVYKLISYLSMRASEMTTKDITQSLWAISQYQTMIFSSFRKMSNSYNNDDGVVVDQQFHIVSDDMIGPILTSCCCDNNKVFQFTPMEVASILRSICKLQTIDPTRNNSNLNQQFYRTVFLLTRPYSDDKRNNRILTSCSLQDATFILQGMSQLNIRDEHVFENLSNVILKNHIQNITSREIATVLYAHRAVHLTPPQQILDRWALEKLGLSIAPEQQNEHW